MSEANAIKMKRPSHPGAFVRLMVLRPLGLNVTQAAKALGVTRPALSALLHERSSLSADMAIRIQKAFGLDMETLMRMQNAYDIAEARKRERLIAVKRYVPKAAARVPKERGRVTEADIAWLDKHRVGKKTRADAGSLVGAMRDEEIA